MSLFTIVWDGIRRRKIRSALSILGIAIASTALFSLLALKLGYERGMRAELEGMGAQIVAVAKGCPYEAIAVIMTGGQVPATLPENVVEEIRNLPNVASASPNVYGAYEYLGLSHPLIGITPEELRLKSWWKVRGRFPRDFGEVVLGSVEAKVFAEKSSEFNEIGDSITAVVGGKPVSLKVVGILETTGSKDDYSTYTTLQTAQELLNLRGRVVAVNVRVKDISTVPETIEAIEEIPDVQAVTVAQVLGTLRNLVQAGQSMLILVMLVALVIGGLGTMNTMLMAVFERTREIGLLKAIGASRWQIFKIFLCEGLGMCFFGGLLGAGAGSLATLMGDAILRRFVSVMPTQSVGQPSLHAAFVSVLFPVGVGVLAALYPALRAAWLSPIQALRSE
ncbi:MAG: ABC transporter permease [Firmicutes bacterium]|jgi:putative ABC transport system permease protein|nr:ABC transporter permease [Bacillota bacterium]MDH7496312.1 ABC transporter permease [Bacillota bacterium]